MCARCHRNKKNLQAILRSGSENVSLSDRMLLLAACRPRVRVKRACAVGMVRRGAQIGRLGSPCKAGGRRCSLTDGCRCRYAPQIRAIGDLIGRAAPPHERSQPRTAHEPRGRDARKAQAERAPIIYTGPVQCQKFIPGRYNVRNTVPVTKKKSRPRTKHQPMGRRAPAI